MLKELEGRIVVLADRRANLASQARFLLAHREQGTLLSQPAFALAQFAQAMRVRPDIGDALPDEVGICSLASW